MSEHSLTTNTSKVLELSMPSKLVAPARDNLRAEYNAIKLDNAPATPQALYLTATVPENVFEAMIGHFATNYVIDLPPFQLERIEARDNDYGYRAYLTARGQHIATVRYGQEDRTNKLTFQISRCLKNDGAIIARMVEAVANVTMQLQTFAACPLDYSAPLLPAVCGTSYGAKTLAQADTIALKICEGNLNSIVFDEMGLFKAGDYFLNEQGTGGKLYARKAAVWYRGQQVANVLWDARRANLERSAKWEVLNPKLYDTTLTREQLVDNALLEIGSSVLKVFRADVAFDSAGLIDFLEAVHTREIEAVREAAYNKGKKYVSLATDKIEGFAFGSRSAGRFVRCYNKTLELKTSNKQYIGDYHKLNGLEGEIGRLEIELKNDYLRTLPGLDWRDFFDRGKAIAIAQQALEGWFDWVPTDSTDSKRNRRERVQIIKFNEVKKSEYKRQTPKPEKSDRMERILIKSLILRAEASNSDAATIEHLQSAATIAEDNNLWVWLIGKVESIDNDLRRRSVLEDRNLSPYFLNRSCYDALLEAYRDYQPLNYKNGELANMVEITHLIAA